MKKSKHTNMTPNEIIDYLDQEQTRQRVTDVELLKNLKIHRTTLWRIKNGKVPATLEQITGIAHALGHTITINVNTI